MAKFIDVYLWRCTETVWYTPSKLIYHFNYLSNRLERKIEKRLFVLVLFRHGA